MIKFTLYLLTGMSLILNLALGVRYARRYFIKSDFKQYKTIDKTQQLELAYPLFIETLRYKQRYNYILFIDSLNLYYKIKKMRYLDSLAEYHQNVNFIVATDGDNSFLLDYQLKHSLRYKHLIFKSKANYLQSAICNKLNINYKVINGDLILDKDGEIVFNPGLRDQNNTEKLEAFLKSIKNQEWQKTVN